MRHSLVVAGLLFALGTSSARAQQPAAPCSLTAETPRRVTQRESTVSGTASLPPNGFLWVLARLEGIAQWWPQGAGAAAVENAAWKVHVIYGEPGQLGTFEVAVIVVGPQANALLAAWVQAHPGPDYPSIPFPNTLPECPMQTLTVLKVSG